MPDCNRPGLSFHPWRVTGLRGRLNVHVSTAKLHHGRPADTNQDS
jgi:hypothetical protein